MSASELLINRRSASRLAEPAPTGGQLRNILRVGIRTPDHKFMQSRHLFVTEGERHERFSAVLRQEAIAAGSDDKVIDKACSAPSRTPLIITVVVKCEENHEVLRWEQEIFVGCAIMTIQVAAVAQGFGGIWRNGALTESPVVHKTLGYREQDKIVGFPYLSTPQLKAPTSINIPDPTPFVTYFR